MALTLEEVRRVADLARLRLSPEEEARLGADLAHILDAVRVLAEVDTTDVPPTLHPASGPPPLREDEVQPSLGTERALANAPERADGSFAVPKIIE